MKFLRRVNLPRLSLFAGLAGCFLMVTYLTLYWDSNPPAMLLTRSDPNQIDLYAEQAHGVRFDASGKAVQTFDAPRVTHYPQAGRTVLTTPTLQMLNNKGEVWNSTSREGVLVGDNEIRLQGEVVVSDSDRGTHLHTEELRYFADRQEITSEVAVLLRKANDTTRAVGMRADLNRNRIELLRKVEGHHVQPL